jgi:hypothetical protein
MSIRSYVRTYETPRFPQDGFSRNLIFEHILNICRENSMLIKIRTKTVTSHKDQYTFMLISCSILIFHTKVVAKLNNVMINKFFLKKSCSL